MQIPGIKRNWTDERFRSLISHKPELLLIEALRRKDAAGNRGRRSLEKFHDTSGKT
jgi:hypothetical protein